MYADLADTIPAKRVLRPTFSLPTPPAQTPAQAAGEQQAVGQVPRTTSSAAQEKYDRGLVLSKTDNLDGAVASFSEAIKLDPKFADALVQRGQLMFRNGNPEGAVADFTKALDIDPRNAAAYKARGMAILYKGDNDGAIIDLTKAIQYAEIDPTSLPAIEIFYARRSRASLYDLKQLYDRELIDLNAMVDGFWKNPALAAALKAAYREQGTNTLMASVYRLRAGVHQRRRNPDSAVGDLSFAIQLDPQRALQYIIERARVQEAAGKREQAMADYQQALELSPANTDVKSALARLKGRT
jgi:tetratricopeptide (TPR) repeat protein